MAAAMEESDQESPPPDGFIWECQTNANPWDKKQTSEWTPYSNAVSSVIEDAYQRQCEGIIIYKNYRINLKHFIQQHIEDPHRQRPVRRRLCHFPSNSLADGEVEEDSSLGQRLSTPLGSPLNCNTTGDTTYYGSPFIHDWLLIFTEGKMTVTFDTIFPELEKGLIKEGRNAPEKILSEIRTVLREVEEKTSGQPSKKRIEWLKACCAKLYTKDCYIYLGVNAALRNNDRAKLFTLGPFAICYLPILIDVFKIILQLLIGSIGVLRPTKIQSVILYRGDLDSSNIVEEYRQAVGDNSKRFKWCTFVSTSRDRAKAEKFARGILYIIEMQFASSNEDQHTDLTTISHFDKEQEVLLIPGAQFQVTKLDLMMKTVDIWSISTLTRRTYRNYNDCYNFHSNTNRKRQSIISNID